MADDSFIDALPADAQTKISEAGIDTAAELSVLDGTELKLLGLRLGDIARLRLLPNGTKKRSRKDDSSDEDEEANKARKKEVHRQARLEAGLMVDADNIFALLPKKWNGVNAPQAFFLVLDPWKSLPGYSNQHLVEEMRWLVLAIAKRPPPSADGALSELDFLFWARLMLVYLKMKVPRQALRAQAEWDSAWINEKGPSESPSIQYQVVCAVMEKLKNIKDTRSDLRDREEITNTTTQKTNPRFGFRNNRGQRPFRGGAGSFRGNNTNNTTTNNEAGK